MRNLVPIIVVSAALVTACSDSPTQADGKVTITQTVTMPSVQQLTSGPLSVSPGGPGLVSTTVYAFQYANAVTGGVPPYDYAWTFGDGEGGSGASVAHVFKSTGDFTVASTVTDSKGSTVKASIPVSVRSVTGRWTATGNRLDADRIVLIQSDTAVSATVNSTNGYGLGTGAGSVTNPRSLVVTLAFTDPPPVIPPAIPPSAAAITYRGTLDDTLLTWTGTVSGYPGCPCSFTATRPSTTAVAPTTTP